MKEFYDNLRERRESLGLNLEDIHRKTRLPLEYLEAIEGGRMERLPSGYERIYLRRYVLEIGLDVAEVLRDYDLLSGRLTAPDRESPDTPPSGGGGTMGRRRLLESINLDRVNKLFWAGFALVTIVGAGLAFYETYRQGKAEQARKVEEVTLSEWMATRQPVDSSAAAPADRAGTTDARAPAAAPGESFELHLRARERTWVFEIRDQADTSEYFLPPGLERTVRARESVRFRLGRADGVAMWLNGDTLAAFGEANQVADVTITAAGVSARRLYNVAERTPAAPDTSGRL